MPSKGGIMKPDITFFGEALPDEFSRRLVDVDRKLTDLVVVIGTSLKVAPVSELVPFLHPHIPQIYISREPIKHHNFDIDLIGDCDIVVAELCKRAGWDLKHEMIPQDQIIDVKTEVGYESRHVFTAHHPSGDKAEESDSSLSSIKGASKEQANTTKQTSSSSLADCPGDSGSGKLVTITRSGRQSGRASPK